MKNLYLLLLFCSGIAFAQPIIQQPSDLEVCDYGNNDGFATFDLTATIPEVLGALNPGTHTVGFFETQTDAENFTNDLGSVLDISNYENYVPSSQTIYIGVYENSNPGLVATVSFELFVNSTPMVWDLQDLVIAENSTDGFAIFDLTLQTPIITNGQAGIWVQYYPTEFDAQAGTNVFPNPETFTNTSNPQRIWVTAQNAATGCFSVGYFDLHVIENDFIVFPDANLKARLLETATPYPTALDTDNHYLVLDATGDGEIQYGEALLASTLSLANQGITNMEGIQYFTNVRNLDVSNNAITALDVSAMSSLYALDCYYNDLISLNLGTLTAIEGLNCYNNNLSVLNVSNQVNLKYLWCFNNQLTTLDISQNTQLINLQFDGNQLNDIDLSTVNLSVLGCGHNLLTDIDLSGQTNLESMNCDSNLFTELDLTANTQLTWITCANNLITTLDVSHLTELETLITGGSLLETIYMKNGATQAFEFTNSPNLIFICVDDSEAAFVQESVDASANVNTVVNSYCDFTPGGDYNTITGIVTFDADDNGCDAGDPVIPLVKIALSGIDGNGAAFSNANGSYSFYLGAGDYSLYPEFENNYFDIFLPIVFNFPTVDGSVITQNFCIVANGVHPDVEVAIAPIGSAQPGFDASYKIIYKNKGNQLASGAISFTFEDAYMDFVTSAPAAASSLPGALIFNYANLLPFESREITVTLNANAPTDTPPVNINDILDFTANITIGATDDTPADNVFEFHQTVIGSFDPNDKACLQGNVVSPTMIGEYLYYVINFENTGTAPATNIVVQDIINASQFEIASLQVMHSSHPVVARLNNNIMEFVFQGINLDTGGHGNILLKVRTLSTLVTGNTVANKANIFFDYNFPIETNFANTTFQALGLEHHNIDPSITVYPNPSSDVVNVTAKSAIQSLQLFDIQGRLLQTMFAGENNVKFDISNKSAGIYFLEITSADGIKIEKLIKK